MKRHDWYIWSWTGSVGGQVCERCGLAIVVIPQPGTRRLRCWVRQVDGVPVVGRLGPGHRLPPCWPTARGHASPPRERA